MTAAPAEHSRRALSGILFLASCNEALQAYGTFNSSPQTTELFAAARERTLVKWVRIGSANAFVLGSVGAWIARSVWPLAGTLLVIAEMEFLYRHAANVGKSQAPPTAGVAAVDARPVSVSAPTPGGGRARVRQTG